jgi:hypothetical protein
MSQTWVTARSRNWWISVSAFLVMYLFLAGGTVRTRLPYIDEGHFAAPAWSLIHNGNTASLTLEECALARAWPFRVTLPGVHRHTYWIMPLHAVSQAAWYGVVGFGLDQLRWHSVFWSLVWIFSIGTVVYRFWGDCWVALAAAVLVALDPVALNVSTLGRMDVMCAALGMAGCAWYVHWQDRRRNWAVAGGHSLIVLAGLTHPIGGICGLAMLLWLQRPWLTRADFRIMVIPYVIGVIGMGAYVLPSLQDFLTQFGANAAGRHGPWRQPWSILNEELFIRYLPAYGFRKDATTVSWFKLMTPLCLGVAVIVAFLRRPKPVAALGFALVPVVVLALVDSYRTDKYIVYVLPGLVALAVGLGLQPGRHRRLAVATIVALGVLYTGATTRLILENRRAVGYAPVVDFLAGKGGLLIGPAEIAFSANAFDGRLRDDFYLGYCSGRRPAYLIASHGYRLGWESIRTVHPEISAHVQRELREHYRAVLDTPTYQVLARVN